MRRYYEEEHLFCLALDPNTDSFSPCLLLRHEANSNSVGKMMGVAEIAIWLVILTIVIFILAAVILGFFQALPTLIVNFFSALKEFILSKLPGGELIGWILPG